MSRGSVVAREREHQQDARLDRRRSSAPSVPGTASTRPGSPVGTTRPAPVRVALTTTARLLIA